LVQLLETVSLERPSRATGLPSAADLLRLSAVEAKPKWTASGTRCRSRWCLPKSSSSWVRRQLALPCGCASHASHHGQIEGCDFWFRENHFTPIRAPSIISLPDGGPSSEASYDHESSRSQGNPAPFRFPRWRGGDSVTPPRPLASYLELSCFASRRTSIHSSKILAF